MDANRHTLLICTVGGSPEPIVAALKCWQPVRVRFVPTKDTRNQIDARVVPLADSEALALDPGRYDILELPDGQDFTSCVDTLRQLGPPVEEWLHRGDQYQVVVDLTGGTKCMSAALALQAHRWRCVFSYVGGSERTKEGVGIVISGKEQVLHSHNPWNSLGFQAIEQFIGLFDQQAFAAAAALADRAMRNISEPSRKRELSAFKLLAEAYDAWDRFDHAAARNRFLELAKYDNDLHAALGQGNADLLRACVRAHGDYLGKLTDSSSPTMQHVIDLLANAARRQEEGRVDDAVARLYRAIEALAQIELAEHYGINNTKKLPLEQIPQPLSDRWSSRAVEGAIFLGLQDAYTLLAALGSDVGARFVQMQLHERQSSPLTARNQSILAHGFERVSEKVFQQLWNAAIQLASFDDSSLPSFPRLGK